MKNIKLSIIITVFNKENFIVNTINSIVKQVNLEEVEFIFIDDKSSDNSIKIIRNITQNFPNVNIIENKQNKGPSIRLNQGAALARGKYFYFIDSDDIAADQTIYKMLSLMERENADFIYGCWKYMPYQGDLNGEYYISANPLQYIINKGGFVRMTQICKASIFHESGGCDENIFIQDESLPLRLAIIAKKFIDYRGTCVLVPIGAEGLSTDKTQQHHDRFFAYYNLMQDCPKYKKLLYKECISSYWKYYRKKNSSPSLTMLQYFLSKIGYKNENFLKKIAQEFLQLKNIRRTTC